MALSFTFSMLPPLEAQNNGDEQAQNNRTEHPQPHNNEEEPARNNRTPEQLQTHSGQQLIRVQHETDHRDGQTATSSTRSPERPRARHEHHRDADDARGEADTTALLLLKELQRTNRLIRDQGERIERLEKRQRYRSPPRRRHRSRSSSSRSPPRRTRRRSPSSLRSPPKRSRRQRSFSRSPPRKSKKNRRLEPIIESPSPDQEDRRLSKKDREPRERSPRDDRRRSGKTSGNTRRSNRSVTPSASDEEDFRSPLSESIRKARNGVPYRPRIHQMSDFPDHPQERGDDPVQQRGRPGADDRLHEEVPPRERANPRKRIQEGHKIEKLRSMNDILKRAQAFISFEEGEAAAIKASRGNDAARGSSQDQSATRRTNDKRRDDRPHDAKERRGPAGRFNDYTPLNASREKILAECKNTEFKNSNIKPPKSNPTRLGTDKSKYCKYHKSHGHLTDECIHLKDAIETLMKEGHLSKYTRKGDPPRRNDRRSSDEGNSPNARPLQVALVNSVF
ncbi:uncharacterized protein LOC131622115 [Vicia villosa]|uniref:uncharacterized protein LOC131622115 n=1 Tax=Vicia villosa TaxID=3911 RepID=UPI00273B4C8E|nr:uncharacterized protein LOC131622115 [Vicia villosa]